MLVYQRVVVPIDVGSLPQLVQVLFQNGTVSGGHYISNIPSGQCWVVYLNNALYILSKWALSGMNQRNTN